MPPSNRNKEYRLTKPAVADLEDIWIYTSEAWSPEQAETYHRKLIAALDRLCAGKISGRDCGDVRNGYFKIAVVSHLLFYRKRDYGYEIVRILNQSMDLPRHL